MTRDLRNASITLNDKEARYLVDLYYQVQEFRLATANQCRSMGEEPHETLMHFQDQFFQLERDIKRALDAYTEGSAVGRWCKSIVGIGPVLAAGLLAYIDIEKAPTAGHIWRFAGLDPTVEWKKGEARPYCAGFKTLCWKIGKSFVKVSNNKNDVYGHYYKARKAYELSKNDRREYEEQADYKLETFNISKSTDAYKSYSAGKLPPAHIQQRAERYATKLFLSHLHYVMYKDRYKCEPPKPFAISILGHAHEIKVPNLDIIA